MNLILFGAPGVGKGTQAAELVKKYKLTHISTGEMFREVIAKQTEIGQLANSYISKGQLVPDEVTVGLVKERLALEDCKNGFILDGFPRTLHQAKCLDEICLELNIKIDYVIDIEVPTDDLINRLSGRRVCKDCGASYHVLFNKPNVEGVCDKCGGKLYQRADDTEESLKQRLAAYSEETMPVVNYFDKLGYVKKIDASQNIENVKADLFKVLGDIK